MALRHTLLGLLARKPGSGYTLYKRLWKPSRPQIAQIYRTLTDMLEGGVVTSKRVEQKRYPARNVFHIGEAGRAEVVDWLKKADQVSPIKEDMIYALWFGSLATRDDMLALLKASAEMRAKELNYYTKDARKMKEESLEQKEIGLPLDNVYWGLALEYMERRCRFDLEWIESAMRRISDAEDERIDVPKGKGETNTSKLPRDGSDATRPDGQIALILDNTRKKGVRASLLRSKNGGKESKKARLIDKAELKR